MLQNIIHFVYFCLPVCEVWLPKDYVFWLSSLYQRAAPIPYPTPSCATSRGYIQGVRFCQLKVFINGQPPSHTLLPALTEAAPKDILGQVAKSIIDHLGTIHGLIDFVLALP